MPAISTPHTSLATPTFKLQSPKYYQRYIQKSIAFLRDELKSKKAQNLIVGLSGGIDSAVVAILCQKAFPNNLITINLPSSTSSPHSLKDAKILASSFNFALKQIPIAQYDTLFREQNPESSPLQIGNFCARIRMALLYNMSSRYNGIVVGTSNKSELMLGYGTIFGDLACAINPIGTLYKTEIFHIAKLLQIPESIISKPPSADLYENQSDEQELGFSYAHIDALLYKIYKKYGNSSKSLRKIHKKPFIKKGFDPNLVEMVVTRIKQNLIKRELPRIFAMRDM